MNEKDLSTDVELEQPVQEEVNQEETLNSIDPDLYKKTAADMMKYKQEKRELQAQLEKLQQEAQAKQTQDLEQRQEWEKLAKLREQELSNLKKAREQEQSSMVDAHKKAAVIQSVGGFLKPEYANFAIKLDNIAMIDGIIDQGTLDSEVERIKREESALLKRSTSSNLPSSAPDQNTNVTGKSFYDMSAVEKAEYRRKLIMERNK